MNTRSAFGLLVTLTLFVVASPAVAAQYKVLYQFKGGLDGISPTGDLMMGAGGTLYGTTGGGGETATCGGCGTVFALSPPAAGQTHWTETVLHRFHGPAMRGASNPQTGVIMDAHGTLYGTTQNGGSSTACGGGCGTAFELTPPAFGKRPWTGKLLHDFDGYAPGPSGLVADAHGNFYGTTGGGGVGCGTVFELTPPAAGETRMTVRILYRFHEIDGCNPQGVIINSAGTLYGTTYSGGTVCKANGCGPGCPTVGGCGVAYSLTPPVTGETDWTETVLYYFTSTVSLAGRLIMDAHGNLYGTTAAGGIYCIPNVECSPLGWGTVFELTRPAARESVWTLNVLYDFQPSEGIAPAGGVVADARGNLYGTTQSGGRGFCYAASGCGTVFELTPPGAGHTQWSEKVLYAFRRQVLPGGLTVDANGIVYGTTAQQSAKSGYLHHCCGEVYEVVP
jgi:uncharacterized repeat protein (TIGR03803 family)